MIDFSRPLTALFDLDGVILDTESQYTMFWGAVFQEYKGDFNLTYKIKGQTLDKIYENWFYGETDVQKTITGKLNLFESEMNMLYIPGITAFIEDIRAHSVKTAVVTSSNKPKMESVYRHHPEFTGMFDRILTAELFTKSKPAPDCYLLGAEVFNAPLENCFVFEDSFNGLKAGKSAGMHVIGLATTNPAETIKDKADIVIPDFTDFSYLKLIHSFSASE